MTPNMIGTRVVAEEKDSVIHAALENIVRFQTDGADVTRLLANRVNHPTENMHWLFAASLFEMIMGVTV